MAGALGGGTSGAILRGWRNIIPGAVMFAIFGAVGQALTDKISNRELNSIVPDPGPKVSWLNSRWSPVKTISNEEYKNIMSEKLLQIKAEIALVDDRIKYLRSQNRPD
ncbi:hypothetical protein BGHDH14_bgh05099 [Blumeria hordei DH14]|uniref:Uncharacterized protein n=1 Tax=Blumeria graminis f. sp. hordei (strain DH14) TaxID=546991 RepID=N1JEN8_BLUG1|nr:hypothetical protein BGHDH14_bgh05099 [Blumeria hordei DH14]